MIEINREIYAEIAYSLREAIGKSDFFTGKVEFETEEFYSTLSVTAVIYRRTRTLPEGTSRLIDDIVPVWWEFTTIQEAGEALNDFSFLELIPYIIEYD